MRFNQIENNYIETGQLHNLAVELVLVLILVLVSDIFKTKSILPPNSVHLIQACFLGLAVLGDKCQTSGVKKKILSIHTKHLNAVVLIHMVSGRCLKFNGQ